MAAQRGRRQPTPGIEVSDFRPWAPEEDGDGEIWTGNVRMILKPAADDHPMMLVNEFISSRLAQAIGLRCPAGDIAQMYDGRRAWATVDLLFRGHSPAPPRPKRILETAAHHAAGCVVFDTWILNDDRHEDNVVFHEYLGLWLIDHDQALGGKSEDLKAVLPTCSDRASSPRLFRGIALPERELAYWTTRVSAVPMSVVNGVIEEARRRNLCNRQQGVALRNFLHHRRDRITSLTTESLRGV